jgi:hypothetical protein
MCLRTTLYVCPHTTIYICVLMHRPPTRTACESYVSSYYYICVLILLQMCPHSYYVLLYICVLIHTARKSYVSSYYHIWVLIHTIYYYTCVLIHTTYSYILVLIHTTDYCICVSSFILHTSRMCPHTTMCVLIHTAYYYIYLSSFILHTTIYMCPHSYCSGRCQRLHASGLSRVCICVRPLTKTAREWYHAARTRFSSYTAPFRGRYMSVCVFVCVCVCVCLCVVLCSEDAFLVVYCAVSGQVHECAD